MLPALPAGSQGTSEQMRYIIPPVCSGSAEGLSTSWMCPENLLQEDPDQMLEPPQLAPCDLKEQQLYSDLPPDV